MENAAPRKGCGIFLFILSISDSYPYHQNIINLLSIALEL